MTTRRVARTSGGPRMKNAMGNDTVEDVIVIVDDEPPVAMVEEELADAIDINPNEPSSSSQPPYAKINIMEYGKEILKAIHRHIGKSSLKELIQLPRLLERTAEDLMAFGLERLISTLNPSVNPLLDFYLDQPPIFGYAKGLLEQLKSDLTYQEGFHPTLEVHSLKEGEYAALGGISFRDNEAGMLVLQHHIAEMKALLSQVSEEMSSQVGFLKVVELKDRLAIRQRVSAEIGTHKE
ncbi:hypothetical protein AMTRI_Chr08g204000 [Amborella trichopoda]